MAHHSRAFFPKASALSSSLVTIGTLVAVPWMLGLVAAGSLAQQPQAPAFSDVGAPGERQARGSVDDPISAALAAVDQDVRTYDQHLTFLANPFLEGRLPGTRGMEIASEYVEAHFAAAGLEPAFQTPEGGRSYRQPFELASTPKLISAGLALQGLELVQGVDFQASSLGESGDFSGPLTFASYSVASAPKDHADYRVSTGEQDLKGQVALVLRFEPMDAAGNSRWATGSQPWSAAANLATKVRAAVNRGASAVLVANPPGAQDPRAQLLEGFTSGRSAVRVPVLMLSAEAGQQLVEALDPGGPGWMGLRQAADEAGIVRPLGGFVRGTVRIDQVRQVAENIGGLLPGRGKLAHEVVLLGAHLDHLGWGNFGSRAPEFAGKAIHPGADDNASGSSAMLMLADRLAADYTHLPPQADARTILVLCFSAEESGLNGSIYYTEHPIRPLDEHALMMNFDMIGRMVDHRLSVSGLESAEGLAEWAKPYLDASPLTIVTPKSAFGGSDHLPFLQKKVPVLFGIIADFHQDYHTPRDTADKINRVDAVEAMRLWHTLALSAALHPAGFKGPVTAAGSRAGLPTPLASAVGQPERSEGSAPAVAESSSSSAGGRMPFPVSLGIRPGNYAEEGTPENPMGVLVESVDPEGAGSDAGLLAGDRLMFWDGEPIADVRSYAEFLRSHEPGDLVKLEVKRGAESVILQVVLREPAGAPR